MSKIEQKKKRKESDCETEWPQLPLDGLLTYRRPLSPPPGGPPQLSRDPTGLEKVGAFSISLLLGHFNNSDPRSGPFMEKALSTFGVPAASH